MNYEYKAHCTAVYDGDTITVDIDLGFGIVLKKQKLRLYGINTPEMRGAEKEQGKISRDWLRKEILDKDIVIKTYKDKKGKYGRWLADIYLSDYQITAKCLSLNEKLVELGLAKEAHY